MAHVHGAAAKSATTHTAHGHAAAGAAMAHQAHAGHAATAVVRHASTAATAGGVAMGSTAVAATHQGKGLMGGLVRHPLLVFGLGLAVGYLIHKYRKEIIESAAKLTEQGTPPARENLDDLVAECPDCPENGGKPVS